MININELEKVITSGKVVTLVIMVDGKELAAVSFTVDTIAFKEILEAVAKTPVKIAEKIAEKPVEKKPDPKVEAAQKSFDAKADKALGKKEPPVDKNDKTKRHPEFNPIPATAEVIKDDDDDYEPDQWNNDDEDSDIDKITGEIKENRTPTTQEVKDFENERQPKNLTNKSHPVHMENDFNPPAQKKTIEPVTAATLEDDDIIPEQIIVTDKKETVKQDVKNEKVQAPAQNASPEIGFSEEQW